jgi:hypothetical protein
MRIWGAFEEIRGVGRSVDVLAGPVKHLFAGAEAGNVLSAYMLLSEVLGQTETVAERAVNHASRTSIGGLQVVAVQIMTRGCHAGGPCGIGVSDDNLSLIPRLRPRLRVRSAYERIGQEKTELVLP